MSAQIFKWPLDGRKPSWACHRGGESFGKFCLAKFSETFTTTNVHCNFCSITKVNQYIDTYPILPVILFLLFHVRSLLIIIAHFLEFVLPVLYCIQTAENYPSILTYSFSPRSVWCRSGYSMTISVLAFYRNCTYAIL